jgi:hypothetical protein
MGDTTFEGLDVASLVAPGQTLIQAIAVLGDVLVVAMLEGIDDSFDRVEPEMRITRVRRREIRVHAGTVPVAFHRLVVE